MDEEAKPTHHLDVYPVVEDYSCQGCEFLMIENRSDVDHCSLANSWISGDSERYCGEGKFVFKLVEVKHD